MRILYTILFAIFGYAMLPTATTEGPYYEPTFFAGRKEGAIIVPVTSDGQVDSCLTFGPLNSNNGKKYPAIFFLHGAGQSGNNLSLIYASSDGGVPYQIETGNWDGTAVNPSTGIRDTFLVFSPQDRSGWSMSAVQIPFFLSYVLAHYPIDTARMSWTGLSAGAEGFNEYLEHLGVTPTGPQARHTVQMSTASDAPTQAQCNFIALAGVKVWGLGDTANDIHGDVSNQIVKGMNKTVPGSARFYDYCCGGHCCWGTYYNPSFTQTITSDGVTATMNIYNFMALTPAAGTPTSNAGIDQTITLPTTTTTLTGSGTPGTGATITGYLWTQLSGTAASITSPTSATTGITGLTTTGARVFQLKVTNNLGASATSSLTVTVNAAPTPTANAGPDQTVSLPSPSITLDGTASVGATSYAWTRLSGPNAPVITSPTGSTTSVTGVIAGTYVFQLSINGGVSTDQVAITVNPASSYPACGSGSVYVIASGSDGFNDGDTAFFYDASVSTTYKPGDILVFTNTSVVPRWKYIELDNFVGNPSCPLIITNGTGQTLVENLSGDTTNGHNGTINLVSDSYVKVDGNKGVPGVYGFKIAGDPVLIYDLGAGIQVVGTSHGIEWEGTYVTHIGTGVWMKNNGDCNLADNYPNKGVDSILLHDNKVDSIWNEGMYLGNTSPDNAPSGACAYDQRPITCGITDTTFFPVPPRIGDLSIYNNIVTHTGRGGIQLAGASVGVSTIYNNTVNNNGMNGDDAQGTAISVGTYSRVNIHDNVCDSTYTWGIAFICPSSTNFVQTIKNNNVNHSGFGRFYNLATTSRSYYNPATEPIFAGNIPWAQNIALDTKPTCNPIDSTTFAIIGNSLNNAKDMTQQILIQNDHGTLQLHGANVICGNVITGTSTPVSIFIDPTATGVTYSTSCATPPTVNAGSDQTITLPTSSSTLTGTATAVSGATITSTTWTLVTGPNSPTFSSASSLTTGISGLIAGVYTFQLSATDSNGNSASDQVTVTVQPAPPPTTQCNCFTQPVKIIFH